MKDKIYTNVDYHDYDFVQTLNLNDFPEAKKVSEAVKICEAACCPPLAHTEPDPRYYDTIHFHWYRNDLNGWSPKLKQEGINPMNTINTTATANVTQKTDLQTQREYLLSRWNEVSSAFSYGRINHAMTEAFNLHVDNKPKTSKELIDGITSGKFTLDAKKAALQEIGAATDNFYDDDDQYTGSPFYALDFGGLSPDRLGYEKAADSFRNSLKLLKDQIMTGDPAASATALQALEAWTPPTTPAN